MSAQRVIIVGGGFAGVTLAQRLERVVASHVEIVLISTENHFVFSPLLAEVVAVRVGGEPRRCERTKGQERCARTDGERVG